MPDTGYLGVAIIGAATGKLLPNATIIGAGNFFWIWCASPIQALRTPPIDALVLVTRGLYTIDRGALLFRAARDTLAGKFGMGWRKNKNRQ